MTGYRFDNTSRAMERPLASRSSSAVPAAQPREDGLPWLRQMPCSLTGGNSNGLLSHTNCPGNKENPERLAGHTPDHSFLLGQGRWAKARLPLHKHNISPKKFKLSATWLVATAALVIAPAAALAKFTGGTVYDPQRYAQENLTLENNQQSDEQKKTENHDKSGIHCNLSGKEKGQNMRRSPSQAMSEEAHNVSLVRSAAKEYGVPEELALAVAYHESLRYLCRISDRRQGRHAAHQANGTEFWV